MEAEIISQCRPPCGAPVTQLEPSPSWRGPVITGLSPENGPAAGGTSVAISGRNFTGATSLIFGANPATPFTVDSDSQITAVSPPQG